MPFSPPGPPANAGLVWKGSTTSETAQAPCANCSRVKLGTRVGEGVGVGPGTRKYRGTGVQIGAGVGGGGSSSSNLGTTVGSTLGREAPWTKRASLGHAEPVPGRPL